MENTAEGPVEDTTETEQLAVRNHRTLLMCSLQHTQIVLGPHPRPLSKQYRLWLLPSLSLNNSVCLAVQLTLYVWLVSGLLWGVSLCKEAQVMLVLWALLHAASPALVLWSGGTLNCRASLCLGMGDAVFTESNLMEYREIDREAREELAASNLVDLICSKHLTLEHYSHITLLSPHTPLTPSSAPPCACTTETRQFRPTAN